MTTTLKSRGGAPYGTGRKSKALTIAEAAYIAGLIDGEGWIGLMSRRATDRPARFIPAMAININSGEVLEWLVEVTGLGNVLRVKSHKSNHEHSYRWMITSSSAASLLRQIRPYLIIKQHSADVVIKLDAELVKNPARAHDLDWILKVKYVLHEANAKGANANHRKAWADLHNPFTPD